MPIDDATLKISVTADISGLKTQMAEAATSVQSASQKMAAALAADGLTASEIASGLASAGLSTKGFAAEEAEATVATHNFTGAMGAARVEAGALDGSMGMMVGGLARVAAQSEVLGPIIAAAFPAFAAFALVDITTQLGEKVYTLYQNVVNNKAEFEALDAVEKSVTETQEALVKSTEAAYVSYLRLVDPVEAAREKLRSLSSERFTIKIEDKELKEIPDYASEAGLTTHKLLQMFTDFPASQVQQKMQDISTIIGLVQQRLAAPQLRGPLSREELEKELEVLQKLSGAIAAVQTDISNQQRLGSAEVGKAQDDQAKDELKKLEEQAREREKLLRSEAEGEKQLKADLAKAKLPQPNEALDESTFAGYYEKIGDAATSAFQDVETERNKESAKIAAESYVASWKDNLTSGMEAASASIKSIQDKASIQKEGVKNESGDSGISKAIQDQAIAASAYQQTVAAVRSEQDALAALTASIYASALPWEQQLQLFTEVEAAQNKLTEDAVANDQRRAQSAQQTADTIAQQWGKAMDKVNITAESNFDSVIRGTEAAKFAFIKMGGDVVISAAHFAEQELLKYGEKEAMKLALHVAGEQAQTTATTTGEGQRETISLLSFVKWTAREAEKLAVWLYHEVTQTATTATTAATKASIELANHVATVAMYAGEAAAAAYASTAAIPIVGPELAPVAAATAFAGALSFGSAALGAVVPQDMAIFAHAKEMILPRHLSEGFQNMINAGGAGSGGSNGRAQPGGGDIHLHNNFNAIDANSVQNFFRNNQGQLTKVLRNAVRNGVKVR